MIEPAGDPAQRALHYRFRYFIEEIADGNIQNLAFVPKPRGADAVRAAFIFLDLLECDVELGNELFLAHAEKRTTKPKPFADMQTDGVVVRDPEMAFGFRVGCHAARLTVETSG